MTTQVVMCLPQVTHSAGPGAGTGSPCANRCDLAVSVFAGVKSALSTCCTEPSGHSEGPGANSAGVVQTVILTL